MNFQDVKVNDKVFIQEYVAIDHSKVKVFYIEKLVSRVIKTQFIVDGHVRYRKSDGRRVGGIFLDTAISSAGYMETMKGPVKIEDQSAAMNILREQVKLKDKIESITGCFWNINHNLPIAELKEALKTLSSIKEKLKTLK